MAPPVWPGSAALDFRQSAPQRGDKPVQPTLRRDGGFYIPLVQVFLKGLLKLSQMIEKLLVPCGRLRSVCRLPGHFAALSRLFSLGRKHWRAPDARAAGRILFGATTYSVMPETHPLLAELDI